MTKGCEGEPALCSKVVLVNKLIIMRAFMILALVGSAIVSIASALTLANKESAGLLALQNVNADKVKVELYFEALCPFCHMVIKGVVTDAVAVEGFESIMDLQLVPYGNAREVAQPDGSFEYTCQHGLPECEGNRMLACAIDLVGAYKAVPFVACMSHGGATPEVDAPACASSSGIELTKLNECFNGDKGKTLIHESAKSTAALNPPHKYVPWLVINGQHTDDIQAAAQADLVAYVCSLYKGTKPAGCPSPKYTLRTDEF